MFAVIESGSKQYHVKQGDVIRVEKLEKDLGSSIEFDKILSVDSKVGQPYVEGVKVIAEVIDNCKTDKVIVFKKKRRQNYRRKYGHRQQITVLRIKEIMGS